MQDNKKANSFKHGLCNSRIYRIWASMTQRCNNPKNVGYYLYGGRGIKVCKRWKKFVNFYADMKDGYSDNKQIDRIDVNGNYTKNNCRWVTPQKQANNQRKTVKYTYKGLTLSAREWDRKLGFTGDTVRQRVKNYNWSIEKALTTPSRGSKATNKLNKHEK